MCKDRFTVYRTFHGEIFILFLNISHRNNSECSFAMNLVSGQYQYQTELNHSTCPIFPIVMDLYICETSDM